MARWLKWIGRLEDDRGARHTPRLGGVDTVSLRLRSARQTENGGRGDPARRSGHHRMRLAQRSAMAVLDRVLVAGFAVLCVSLCAYFGIVQPYGWRTALGFVLFFLVLVLAAYAADARRVRAMRRELEGLPDACPVCAYDLTGARPAEDGCAVCPECGAAWDLERMRA